MVLAGGQSIVGCEWIVGPESQSESGCGLGILLYPGPQWFLLLAGEVNVKNEAGTVLLNKPGFATTIRSRLVAPILPRLWSADNIQHALTRTVTRQGMKQLERELRHFNIPGLGGKDRLPDIIKPKGLKPNIGPGGSLQKHLRKPKLRIPW